MGGASRKMRRFGGGGRGRGGCEEGVELPLASHQVVSEGKEGGRGILEV